MQPQQVNPRHYLNIAIIVGCIFCIISVGAFYFVASGAYRSLRSDRSTVELSGTLNRDDAQSVIRISANLSVEAIAEAVRVVKVVENGPICSIRQENVDPKNSGYDIPWDRDTTRLYVTIGKEDRECVSHGLYVLKPKGKSWEIIKSTYVET